MALRRVTLNVASRGALAVNPQLAQRFDELLAELERPAPDPERRQPESLARGGSSRRPVLPRARGARRVSMQEFVVVSEHVIPGASPRL